MKEQQKCQYKGIFYLEAPPKFLKSFGNWCIQAENTTGREYRTPLQQPPKKILKNQNQTTLVTRPHQLSPEALMWADSHCFCSIISYLLELV